MECQSKNRASNGPTMNGRLYLHASVFRNRSVFHNSLLIMDTSVFDRLHSGISTREAEQTLCDVLHRCYFQLSDRDKKLFNLKTSTQAVYKKTHLPGLHVTPL